MPVPDALPCPTDQCPGVPETASHAQGMVTVRCPRCWRTGPPALTVPSAVRFWNTEVDAIRAAAGLLTDLGRPVPPWVSGLTQPRGPASPLTIPVPAPVGGLGSHVWARNYRQRPATWMLGTVRCLSYTGRLFHPEQEDQSLRWEYEVVLPGKPYRVTVSGLDVRAEHDPRMWAGGDDEDAGSSKQAEETAR